MLNNLTERCVRKMSMYKNNTVKLKKNIVGGE